MMSVGDFDRGIVMLILRTEVPEVPKKPERTNVRAGGTGVGEVQGSRFEFGVSRFKL